MNKWEIIVWIFHFIGLAMIHLSFDKKMKFYNKMIVDKCESTTDGKIIGEYVKNVEARRRKEFGKFLFMICIIVVSYYCSGLLINFLVIK